MTTTDHPREAPGRAGARRLFAVTAGGAFLVSLDVAVANALLPAIAGSFGGTGRSALSWVITAYVIAFAAALVPAGRLADRAGRRRAYLSGLAIFAAGSLACAAAPAFAVLVAGRIVQGLGAAAAQPSSLGLLLSGTDPRRRASVTARWAGAGALGMALGPLCGGVAASAAGWRWAFMANLPVIAVLVALAPGAVPETGRHPGRPLSDVRGVALLAGAAGLLALGISEAATWPAGRAAATVGLGVLLSILFVRRSLAAADPVLDVRALRRPHLALVTLATVLYSASFFGLLFTFVLFLIGDWHLSTVQAGLCTAPAALVVVAMSARVGELAGRVGHAPLLAAGPCVIAAGLLLAVVLIGGSGFHAVWLAIIVVVGVGIGLCYPVLSAAAVAGLPVGEVAAATALNQCARQLGAGLGVAASVAVLGGHDPASVARFHGAWAVCAGFAAAAALAGAALRRHAPRTSGDAAIRIRSSRHPGWEAR